MDDAGSVRFRGRVRYWDEAAGAGLAVVDVPADLVPALGGRRQYRVAGTLDGAPFSGSGMLVAGGGYCIGLSRAALKAAGADIGREVDVVAAAAEGGASTMSIRHGAVRRWVAGDRGIPARAGRERCATRS